MERFGIDESNIIDLLQSVLIEEDITEGVVNITGTTDAGDGYTGLVIFAEAFGNKDGKKVNLNFAVKHSTTNKSQRGSIKIATAYKLESCVYDKVFSAYQQFLEECNIPPLNCFGKFYKSSIQESCEILVFENLKTKGYEIHDIKNPFNLDHIKFVLKEYAKFHSLGLAFKDQKPEEFAKLSSEIILLRAEMQETCYKIFEKMFSIFIDALKLNKELCILEKVQKHTVKELLDIAVLNNKYSTIIHGDCWNNNFMFKYAADNKDTPENVAILDWQLTSIGNPIVDLSYFIFAGISTEDLHQVENLVEFYYSELSEYTTKLGSDINHLYPKHVFLQNWKDYAKFTILLVPIVYTLNNKSKADIPDISQLEKMEDAFEYRNEDSLNNRTMGYARYLSDKGLI